MEALLVVILCVGTGLPFILEDLYTSDPTIYVSWEEGVELCEYGRAWNQWWDVRTSC